MRLKNIILFVALVLFAINAWSQEKLIFAIDLIRHGDRTPIHSIPKSPPYHRAEGPGQLTPEGMQQEYQLGAALRKMYVDQFHLLPPHYDGNTMYVRSSDYDRTLMSATSFLMGLYPLGSGPYLADLKQPALPHAYQPIPIHTLPQINDTALVPRSNRHQFEGLLRHYVFSSTEWKEKNAQLRNKYATWSKATGINITNLSQLSSLGNSLYIDNLHHVPLPQDLSSSDIKEIIQAGKWATAAMFKPKEIGIIAGHDFLVMITDYLQKAVHHENKLRYVLLSGHDTTILAAMSAMQTPLSEPPGYASDLNFSLYEITTGNFLIKVRYNGYPVSIPACSGSSSCTLQQFSELLRQ